MNDKPEVIDEKALVKGCLRGDSLSQEKLFKLYYGLMLGICLRYTTNRSDAKEILQEGFIKIFNKLELFEFKGTLLSWMKKVMVNTAIDRYRSKKIEPVFVEIKDNLEFNEDILTQLHKEELLNELVHLPEGYRLIFNLYVIEGFSHREIAEKLNITEGTSKSQLYKAREYLKQIIESKNKRSE